MEPEEASMFETSEMLATSLASTPLLLESWRMCNRVNNMFLCNFLVDKVGDVGYVAFSWASTLDFNLIINNSESNKMVPIAEHGGGLFSPLRGGYKDDDDDHQASPPMVHATFLNLFLSLYKTPDLQNQMVAVMEQSKAIVITGHSIGGTTASLATLWLLSNLSSIFSHLPVLCITFGSPLLGNDSLSRAILRERWGDKFCHLVFQHDIVPRLLFAPFPSLTPELYYNQVNHLHHNVLAHVSSAATTTDGNPATSPFRPFGSYLFSSEKGAICLDNAIAVVRMLYLMFADASTDSSCIDDHFRYGEVVMRLSQQFLKKRCLTQELLLGSSYEAGISLALDVSGLTGTVKQGRECLMEARQQGCTPNLNSANLAIRLSKVTPNRAQIEWYKACCDDSDDQMGYYDSFKQRVAKRDQKVNMNRAKLANFWDEVLRMIENNELPHDFHRRAKWVNASQFYKLLVEPLDIANYYRSGLHMTKGHYLTHGRERRYKIFDKWWRERDANVEENRKRSKYAGLTQDSCFWARVEEATELVNNARTENSPQKLAQMWHNIEDFESYAKELVENKEVSKDVVAPNSSYSMWVQGWKELKSQRLQVTHGFLGHLGGQVVP